MKNVTFDGKIFWEIPKGQEKYFICKETTEILSLMRPNFPKILKPVINSNGYLMVGFFTHPNRINVNIHRAMMETFVKNPNNYRDINHIDGNKLNNQLNNLEYCTSSYNIQHSFKTGLHKKFTNKSIYKFDKNGKFLQKYNSLREAAKDVGCNPANICTHLKRKSSHAMGFLWDYSETYTGIIPEKIQKGFLIKENNNILFFNTEKEAINYLQISRTTFYKYCDNKNLLKNKISIKREYY